MKKLVKIRVNSWQKIDCLLGDPMKSQGPPRSLICVKMLLQSQEIIMSMIHTKYSAVIDAAPEAIYEVLSDYLVGHKAILPKPYFADMVVREGGRGAGTVIDVHMEVYGVKRSFLGMVVSEPQPGRVLAETVQETGEGSTFTLEPLADGRQTRVTIANNVKASPGLAGFMERLINPSITRRIFKKELENLAAYVKEQGKSAVPAQ
jgi:hypothetical protein